MDRLACMTVFVKSVEQGSISLAANELNLSPQLAGKQLRMLEASLGVKLLNRTTRRQSLTDSGRVFYERAKNILEELAEAETLVAQTRSTPRGRLRISAPITFGSHALAPELPEYAKDHPEVTVDLNLTNRTVDLVEEGFDVAFRTGDLADSALQSRRLRPLRLVLCAAPAYLKTAGTPSTPEELRHHECLLFSHTSMRKEWLFHGPQGTTTIAIKGRFSTDSGEALRAAAVAGMGLILQPEELVREDIKAGRLLPLLSDFRSPDRQLHLLYPPDRQMTPRLRSFLDFAVRKFGKG